MPTTGSIVHPYRYVYNITICERTVIIITLLLLLYDRIVYAHTAAVDRVRCVLIIIYNYFFGLRYCCSSVARDERHRYVDFATSDLVLLFFFSDSLVFCVQLVGVSTYTFFIFEES
jgi:hypothetical protein